MGNYFDSQEELDLQYLRRFNDKYQWFETISGTPKYTGWDATCTDFSGNTVCIEMKAREKEYDDGTFIEPKKVYELAKVVNKGDRALYFNFYSGGTVLRAFSLTQPLEMEYRPNIKIYDKGKRQWKTEARFNIKNDQGKTYRL